MLRIIRRSLDLYPIVKLVERANVRLGYGDFGVLDGYKCNACYTDPSIPESECLLCRSAWVWEVGHVEWSDAAERRANIWMGIACLSLAASSWMLNNALSWWTFGPFMASSNAALLAYIPDLGTPPLVLRAIYISILVCVFAMAVAGITFGLCFAFFMFCMNPGSKRTFRHMTPSAILTMLAGTTVYVYVLLQRVWMMDGILIVVPIFGGIMSLLLVLCMKKTEGEGTEAGAVKLV